MFLSEKLTALTQENKYKITPVTTSEELEILKKKLIAAASEGKSKLTIPLDRIRDHKFVFDSLLGERMWVEPKGNLVDICWMQI